MSLNRVFNRLRLLYSLILALFCYVFYFFKLYFSRFRFYNVAVFKVKRFFWAFGIKFGAFSSYFSFGWRSGALLRVFQLACVAGLFFVAIPIYKNSVVSVEAQSSALPNCDTVTSPNPVATTTNPTVNCRYRNLPSCSHAGAPATPQHRVNCYDVVDLPLCSHIASGAVPLGNCVRLCSHPDFSATSNPAIFNTNCIRFCDSMPTGMTASVGSNCVQRLCHQLPLTVSPVVGTGGGANCSMARCDRLWPKEHFRMYPVPDSAPSAGSGSAGTAVSRAYNFQYCEGAALKCYDMPQDLLRFVDLTYTHKICQNHTCPPGPGTDTCSHPNEYSTVLAKSTSYRAAYDAYVSDIQDSAGRHYTSPVTTANPTSGYPGGCSALPLCPLSSVNVFRDYKRCSPLSSADSARVTADPLCDTSGPGSQCQGTQPGQQQGYCFRTVDCSLTANAADPMCVAPTLPITSSSGSDPYNSWFYRPAPSSKATGGLVTVGGEQRRYIRGYGGAGGGNVEPGLCYGRNWRALQSVTGRRYSSVNLLFGTLHFYYYDLFEDSISPGVCGMGTAGGRGNGYIYLKGTNGLLYNDVDDDVMYYKGDVTTSFANNVSTHSVELCLRFKNALCTECEGRRECIPTASSTTDSSIWTQICGVDVCRTFSITVDPTDDTVNPQECMMRDGNDMSAGCQSVIDNYLRVRAVYYEAQDSAGGREGVICGYLDAKGHTSYNGGRNFGADRGNQEIGDGKTCQNDNTVTDGVPNRYDTTGCHGYDSASDEGQATKWRNVHKADFVLNNQPTGSTNGKRGYYDRDGNFYPADYCAPIVKRSGSAMLYNLANVYNSPTMYNPPVIIASVNSVYGGYRAATTDFHRPEVLIQYGTTPLSIFADGNAAPTSSCYRSSSTANCPRAGFLSGYNQTFLSLDAGELTGRGGTDTSPGGISSESPAFATLYSQIPGVGYRVSTQVYLEKDYDVASGRGIVCVYEKTRDGSGNISLNPLKVGCVYRNPPFSAPNWIASSSGSDLFQFRLNAHALNPSNPSTLPAVAQAYVPPAYHNFTLRSHSREYCTFSIENYKFCVRRHYCTQLARECSDASSRRSSAVIAGSSTRTYDAMISECQATVLPECLNQRDLPENGTIFNILETNDYGAHRCYTSDSLYLEGPDVTAATSSLAPCTTGQTPFLYGWHNIIEITRGLENRLSYVVAHKVPDGRMGICQVRADSRYLTDTVSTTTGGTTTTTDNTATNCLSGGDGYNCRCVTVPSLDFPISDPVNFEVRRATAKEMGWFSRITVRNVCTAYDGSAQTPPVGENFPIVNVGSSVVGSCDLANGWTYSLNANYQNNYPRVNCVTNTAPGANRYQGVLDMSTLQNQCVRRTCTSRYANAPNIQGEYLGSYDDAETGECKGARHGFANWPSYLPPSTLRPPEFIRQADSCITGFKAVGSTVVPAGATAVAGNITGYTGGELPRRLCALSGNYSGLTRDSVDLSSTPCSSRNVLSVEQVEAAAPVVTSTSTTSASTNPAGDPRPATRTRGCVRITCPAIIPAQPTSITDVAGWNAWFASGGASFPEVSASRHLTRIQPGSTSTGTCNTAIGFFQTSGGSAPTRECDYLGNWGPVINPCSTLTCSQITATSVPTNSSSSNNGFATWDEVTATRMASIVSAGGNADQVTATACHAGYVQNPYPPATNPLGVTLPNAADLTRPAEMPKRYCIGGTSGSSTYRIWRAPTNPCINQCPGASQDNRIGVGRTTHSTSSGSINIDWPATDFGQVAYISNWTGPEANLNASHFIQGRTNGLYLLKRRCGANGRWEDPEPMCALNNGIVGSANFSSTATRGYVDSIQSYTSAEHAARATITGFETVTGVCSVPLTINPTERARILGLISGLTSATPVLYCKIPGTNIDQTYLERSSGSNCGVCNAPTTPTAVNARLHISASSSLYYPGQTISGSRVSCNTPGHYAMASSSSAAPYVTCDPGGAGTWVASNAGSCLRSCRVTSSFLRSMTVGAAGSCGSSGSNYVIRSSDISSAGEMYVKSGEIFEFMAYSSCRTPNPIPAATTAGLTGTAARDACYYWRRSYKCNDGTTLLNENTGSSFGGCPYSMYDYPSSAWGSQTLHGISPNPNFVTYRHIQRTSSIATGMGMLKEDDTLANLSVDCTNCSTAVRTWGVATPPSASSYAWGTFGVNNPALYPVLPTSRVYSCGSYSYVGPSDLAPFAMSASSYVPGAIINGSCGTRSVLVGLAPKITCQSDGTWLLENDANCRNSFSTGTSAASRFLLTTNPGDCPNGYALNVYLPANYTIDDGQEGGFTITYACGNTNDTVTYQVDLRSSGGTLTNNINLFRTTTNNGGHFSSYIPGLGWSAHDGMGFYIPANEKYAITARAGNIPSYAPPASFVGAGTSRQFSLTLVPVGQSLTSASAVTRTIWSQYTYPPGMLPHNISSMAYYPTRILHTDGIRYHLYDRSLVP